MASKYGNFFFWLDNEHTEQFKYQSSHQKWMLIVSTKPYPRPSHALASILGQWNDVLGGALFVCGFTRFIWKNRRKHQAPFQMLHHLPPKSQKMSMIGTNQVH